MFMSTTAAPILAAGRPDEARPHTFRGETNQTGTPGLAAGRPQAAPPPSASVSPSPEPGQPVTPFVFASAGERLVARGAAQILRVKPDTLAAEVSRVRAERADDADAPVLVGVLPFDWRHDAYLIEPRAVIVTRHRASGRAVNGRAPRVPGPWRSEVPGGSMSGTAVPGTAVSGTTAAAGGDKEPGAYRVTAWPSRRDYERAVGRALERMEASASASDREALRKVVLARTLTVEGRVPFDPAGIVERLSEDPGVTTFSVPLPDDDRGRRRTLVGATPELLLRRDGLTVTSMPLAGSARRGADESRDRAAAEFLIKSSKDLREHAVVVEWIADHLSSHCKSLRVSSKPRLVSTRSLWHLATPIQGTLRDESASSVELAAALHPTPAVCGLPVDLARATIQELEPFDRGFFAGAVGWCAANGDGVWMMAIRCAQLSENSAQLFAGAGIVPGSTPGSEADETFAKFGALLDALSPGGRRALLAEEDL
jgi:isochorismate synthase